MSIKDWLQLFPPHCETQADRPLGNFADFMAEGEGRGTVN